MAALIDADAASELVQPVREMAANTYDVLEANALLQGEGMDIVEDAGYQGTKRPDAPARASCTRL